MKTGIIRFQTRCDFFSICSDSSSANSDVSFSVIYHSTRTVDRDLGRVGRNLEALLVALSRRTRAEDRVGALVRSSRSGRTGPHASRGHALSNGFGLGTDLARRPVTSLREPHFAEMAEHDDPVRFLAYGRLSDGLFLATFKSRRSNAATEETCKKVLESGNLKPNAQLTVTVTPEIGTLHLNAGSEDVIAVVTASGYPRRQAFKLLDEIRVQISQAAITSEDVKNADGAGDKKTVFQKALPFLKETCLRFSETRAGPASGLEGNDKVARVGAQVNEVKEMMEGNINRMLDNQETIGAVEDKSEALRAGASQFSRRSEHIKRAMWWRLVKLKLIFAALVTCVLGYILVPIIVQATKDDNKSAAAASPAA